jgi:hypothetical protein
VASIGAGLALAFQLLLPFMAMPQMALVSSSEAHKKAVLAQAVAAWGNDALCVLSGAARDQGKSPLSDHPCPICWVMQQAANLLPPEGPPLASRPMYAGVEPALTSIDTFVQSPLPPSPPRGPPAV